MLFENLFNDRPRGPVHRRLPAALALTLGIGLAVGPATGPAEALHPNHPLGASPEKSYQGGGDQIDHVDLFSGSLSMTIPIGPLTLNYNSNIWRYKQRAVGATIYTEAYPDRERNAGQGWHLGWGEVYSPSHWYNETDKWMYVGEDGGRHYFYDQLHRGENDGDGAVYYTRDNTYIRLIVQNNTFVDLEFPDGSTRRFNSFTGGLGTTYRLEKGWTRFSSASDPEFSVDYSGDPLVWTLTDRYGRSHSVHFTDQYDTYMNRVITRVDTVTVGGGTNSYDFSYVNTLVSRSCKDDDPATNDRIPLPHLQRIDLPDGTFYEMGTPSNLNYYNVCEGGIEDVPGVLKGIQIPTGGQIDYAFQEYEFPPSATNSVFATTAGVGTRTLRTAGGQAVGEWNYRTTQIPRGNGGTPQDDPQMIMEVVYKDATPGGLVAQDCRKHFFNARYWQSPAAGYGWEYGLPFVYTEQNGGRYLSSQVWTAATAGGACTGTKLRSNYLKYRKDATPGSGTAPASEWYHTNRQMEASRTVYHDDSNRWVDTQNSVFDGLGHFRQVIKTGNLWSGSTNNEQRKVVTNFNRTTGVYPGSYVPVSPATPWILGIFNSVEVTEADALGNSTSRTEFNFSNTTGFLGCTRVLESGTARGPHDLLTLNLRDSLGQLMEVKSYGGDLGNLGTNAGCGSLPAQPQAWVKHTYSNGSRETSRAYAANGTPAPFYSYDVDLDPSTGVVLASRDAAGFETTYLYDSIGRPDKVVPDVGAELHFIYTNPNPGAQLPGKVRTKRVNSSGTTISQAKVFLDDFGRTWKQQRRMPGGAWVEKEFIFNGRGWPVSVSEWGDLTKKTQYLGYDPFGRATTVRPPDGAGHDLKRTYTGIRTVVAEAAIALAGGESFVPKTQQYDRYGRLRETVEISGPGLPESTSYRYDVGNRLTQVMSGNVGPQVRLYDYDNRGFLLAETHPEKGNSGNGTVLYQDHDVRGRALRTIDGPHDLERTLDAWGRITEVRDKGASNRLVKEFEYDGAVGYGLGKVWKTRRHNWVSLGQISFSPDQVVEEVFSYQGVGGAVSKKQTNLLFGSNNYSFEQGYAYNQLGLVLRTDYPECTFQPCTSATGAGRQVTATFSQGLLNGLTGWVNSTTYHPNGLWDEIRHANGVTDHLDLDTAVPSRIGRLRSTGSNQPFDTGVFAYDGAGNLKTKGSNTFVYDQVNRLVNAVTAGRTEAYSYDRAGNLKQKTTSIQGKTDIVNYSVNSQTNRLNAASYDGAGNLTSWGFSTYTYNTNNQISTTDGEGYLYNAAGERVVSAALFARAEQFTVALRDRQNRPLSLFRFVQGNWYRERDYIYAGSRMIASETSAQTVHYHLDHLGSPRMLTDATTGNVVDNLAFMPYGQEVSNSTASNQEPLQFTGHERDQATGLDYMHARHYFQSLGRFFSVDPVRGNAGRPQSLNRYAYALGNPLRFVDPDGRRPQVSDECSRHPSCYSSTSENLQILTDVGQHAEVSRAQEIMLTWMINTFFGGSIGAGRSISFATAAVNAGTALADGSEGGSSANPVNTPEDPFEESMTVTGSVDGSSDDPASADAENGGPSSDADDSSQGSSDSDDSSSDSDSDTEEDSGGLEISFVSNKPLAQIEAETILRAIQLTQWGNMINRGNLNLQGGGMGSSSGRPGDCFVEASGDCVSIGLAF